MLATLLAFILLALVVPYILLMVAVIKLALRAKRPAVGRGAPSVSVIIPARNEAQQLPQALASLSAQDYSGPLEFVIVDDRSTDDTADVVRRFAQDDSRFKLVSVTNPSRKLAPKVHAVNVGIRACRGDVIMTSDADCTFGREWVAAMTAHLTPGVAMVTSAVQCTVRSESAPFLQRFETVDLLSLMLTKRALLASGRGYATSANNQAYLRSAFVAVGGFGSAGRAPSGDEDLLAQRFHRLGAGRIVFADDPRCRVRTRPMPSLSALLRQRRRWVSRYRHMSHFEPRFLAGILLLGAQSVALVTAFAASAITSAFSPLLVPLFALKVAVELVGIRLAVVRFGRQDLWGWPTIAWAMAHPLFIAVPVVWALIRSGEWSTPVGRGRPALARRRLRYLRRRIASL